VTFAGVVGHEAAVARLRRIADEDRVPGAMLFLGPPGIGKRTLADAVAARLLCEAVRAGDACGTCRHCVRLAAGTHPDVRVVTRDEDRRDVRIEQVRELGRWLALQPLMASCKVAILDGAHCLNEHGQNALLKTLEEPPARTVVLLTASAAALLLPTVRSRCQVLRLEPLPPAAVARVLVARGVAPERAERLAGLAEGAPGQVLALEADAAAATRDAVLAALPRLADLDAAELSALAQELSRGPVDVALVAVTSWYRDVLQTALLGEELPLRNAGAAPAIREAAARLGPGDLLRQLGAVCDTIEALGRNANRMLALETMLLTLRRTERRPEPAWTSPR
jgi:DNA polymerase-3 subunit delta'